MGIDPYNDWAAQYEILPGKEKVVNELVKLAKMRDEMLTCTTPRGPAPGAHEYKYE